MPPQNPLTEDARYWELQAQADPMWAVLSEPDKRGRKWRLDRFFETGRREVSLLMFHLAECGMTPPARRALDFGCGIGRLSQALATYFDEVVGVDIAETMIALAERLNRFPATVSYRRNIVDDLRIFPDDTFSFIYSDIVLQHLAPEVSARYLREFVRVLAGDGTAVFQLPAEKRLRGIPAAPEALSPDAYRAQLRCLSEIPPDISTGSSHQLRVEIRNASDAHWLAPHDAIRLGNHWRDADSGAMLIQDDGRVPVPALRPGEVATATLMVQAPERPGLYSCELDLVHEGLFWFADQGSPTVKLRFRVGAIERSERLAETPRIVAPVDYGSTDAFYDALPRSFQEPGDFPMHGIPKDDVYTLLKECGGRIVAIEEDERCGREWIGYRYYVQKA